MTHKLPPNLLALFSPRPPLRYLPASDHPQEGRKTHNIGGVASFLPALEEHKEEAPEVSGESWFERKERIKAEKREAQVQASKEGTDRSMPASIKISEETLHGDLSDLHRAR